MRKISGIYTIINHNIKKVYIGTSDNVALSIKNDLSGIKSNVFLQEDLSLMNLSEFTISIVTECCESLFSYYYEIVHKKFVDANYIIYNDIINKRKISERNTESKLRMSNNMSNNIKGKIYVNNGKMNKMINQEELDEYINKGWIKGKYKNSLIWMNNGIESVHIDTALINNYKQKGYIMGKKLNKP